MKRINIIDGVTPVNKAIMDELQDNVETAISSVITDTGWQNLELYAGNFENYPWAPLQYRKINNVAYIRGGGTIQNATLNKKICKLPREIWKNKVVQLLGGLSSGDGIVSMKIVDGEPRIDYLSNTKGATGNVAFYINESYAID